LIQTVKAGKTVQNMYNVGGNRISKTVDGATTNFLLDLDNNIILELDGSDIQIARNGDLGLFLYLLRLFCEYAIMKKD
ncbi:MAG TPA: hypothetical protein DCP90_00655, partial [Clostridiales bacterium]|nr:hypothetical protein [Clostridiales bacterium]